MRGIDAGHQDVPCASSRNRFFAAPGVLDLVDPDGSVAERGLSGELPNEDTWGDGSWPVLSASVRND
ncbi:MULTISPECIES: hypothetical protein [unclassified Lysobacter]|uniref:hypothetical protein n=1 Tax=unclassified Lysobacter TaxID=2635362 RepID=UPI001BED2017|nr:MULTISPECIES: hypothetical protein [unclassified Lysobacter]MBT2746497.1 hypothetical protein [Lysobacter sp. ISL-42]MBT2752999.1 hypothetical protein [Lysobacter sp. ISL-50]MBT2777676.1 hypothetical protein [Lysobacter sp. ISL-54]MBT2782447.1 hypothetical protein [Lysobacter sp. ISL-52]